MNGNERVAAWLGLVGLVSGAYVFAVFVWPKMRGEYLGR